MDLQILRTAALAVGMSEDTLTRRIDAGVIPASAVRRGQRVPGRKAKVTLLDVDAVRIALAPPHLARALAAKDQRIRDLEAELADVRTERDQLLAARYDAVPSDAGGEGVVLEGDAIVERHGLRARSGQRS